MADLSKIVLAGLFSQSSGRNKEPAVFLRLDPPYYHDMYQNAGIFQQKTKGQSLAGLATREACPHTGDAAIILMNEVFRVCQTTSHCVVGDGPTGGRKTSGSWIWCDFHGIPKLKLKTATGRREPCHRQASPRQLPSRGF
jgi:hypothetical protein